MALSEIDRVLLANCLRQSPQAWEEFVDRFLGLIIHVVNHTAQSRSIRLTSVDTEDLAAEVLMAIVADDFALLRRFRGASSLATYLTVIARRIVVRQLLKTRHPATLAGTRLDSAQLASRMHLVEAEQRLSDLDQVEALLRSLDGKEADVVRMYHLEGLSYQEISDRLGIAENSVGPTLSRARQRLRHQDQPLQQPH